MAFLKKMQRKAKAAARTVNRGLTAASKVPGMSSALTIATGGLAAVNPAIRGSLGRDLAIGAAVGGGALVASKVSGSGAPMADEPAQRAEQPPVDLGELGGGSAGGGIAGGLGVTERLAGTTSRDEPTSRVQGGGIVERARAFFSGDGEAVPEADVTSRDEPSDRTLKAGVSAGNYVLVAVGLAVFLGLVSFLIKPRR